MYVKYEYPKLNLQLKFGYCITIKLFKILHFEYKSVGQNIGQTDILDIFTVGNFSKNCPSKLCYIFTKFQFSLF